MIDVKRPLRKAYYDLLNGALTLDGNPVPVGDDLVDDDAEAYVILGSQTGHDNGTFQTFDSVETIDLDIVYKGGEFVNKNAVDDIADQILNLLFPNTGGYGLAAQPGVQINCIVISQDRHLNIGMNPADSVMRRIITLSQKVRQTTEVSTGPDNPGGGGIDGGSSETAMNDATDANFTMLVNASIYLPNGVLTQDRNILIPAGAATDFMKIFNNEESHNWNLTGSPVYLSDGVTIVSQLMADTNYYIQYISGKWRILN